MRDDDDDQAARKDRDRVDVLYGLVVGFLYVVAVSVQVYLVVDEVTHGALTDDMKARGRRLSAVWRERRRIDREVRDSAPHVVWEAMEALHDGEGSTT